MVASNPTTTSRLEAYGQEAASTYRMGQMSLTAAVVGTIKHAGLNPRQVQRVVEIANVTAFLDQYKTADDKYIDFPQGPADPAEVLHALGRTGATGVSMRTASAIDDYSSPPAVKQSSQVEEAFWQSFGTDSKQAEDPYANPYEPVETLLDQLSSAEKVAAHQMQQALTQMTHAAEIFYSNVKQAALQGHSLGEVLQALQQAAQGTEHVKSAFAWAAPKLLDDGVFRSEDDLIDSFQKVASMGGRRPNPDHPMVQSFADIHVLGEKIAKLHQAQRELAQGAGQLRTWMKTAAVGSSRVAGAAKEVASQLKNEATAAAGKAEPWQVWKKVTDFTAKHAPTVGNGIRTGAAHVISTDAAKSFPVRGLAWGAENAVKYAPHLAVAGAGYNAYQAASAMRASPGVQQALSYVPLTRENEAAQNEATYRAMQGY